MPRLRSSKKKSSISKARSYLEVGAFWDEHDLSMFWEMTRRVKVSLIGERAPKMKSQTTRRASLAELDALFASLQHRAFRGEL